MKIEDLRNAVLGAELEAVQMAGPAVGGSLAFCTEDRVVFSSGLVHGRLTLYGPLSAEAITLGIGLRQGPGSRHWLNVVSTGNVSDFLPGDIHDAYYTGTSLYVAASLTAERLEEEAAREGVPIKRGFLRRTGLHSKPLAAPVLAQLDTQFTQLHAGNSGMVSLERSVGRSVLRAVMDHYARAPITGNSRGRPIGYARIVDRAREYIRDNLAAPITLDSLAEAAGTSRRTLERAFREVLEDSPSVYVRRLRLHRIRCEIASEAEARSTISMIAARCGMREHGRMAGWYRELFGESPSGTLANYLAHQRHSARL